jgi:dienelactone hydrolase
MKKIVHGCRLLCIVCIAATQTFAQPSITKKDISEKIITAVTSDSLELSGLFVKPGQLNALKTGVVWVHGAGQNFYYPSYVQVGRLLAQKGFAFVTANTRMHDIGSFLSYKGEVALRGGTYWGIPSQVSADIKAWIDEMIKQGCERVILVGHSAGGSSVRAYQAMTNDTRVAGIVMASAAAGPSIRSRDTAILPTALKMVKEGRGQDLLPMLRLSAATYVDYSNIPDDIWDFYGSRPSTANPAISLIRCHFLAWFGTADDVGDAKSLEKLKQMIESKAVHPPTVTTMMIEGADHLYDGDEVAISDTLSKWMSETVMGSVAKNKSISAAFEHFKQKIESGNNQH